MKNILLLGEPVKDLERLRDCMDLKHPENNPVFLIPEGVQLYEYIDALKVSDKILLALRICNNLSGLNAIYQVEGKEGHVQIDTLKELLDRVEPGRNCLLTLLGDMEDDEKERLVVRNRLVEVMQQLVYLNLPLEQIQVRTEHDIMVRKRVKRFLDRLGTLKKLSAKARRELARETPRFLSQGAKGLAAGMDGSLSRIQTALEKAGNNELKIMAAAMKKVGKSVIVNSILEQSIAPTSQTLPTPNNCIYRKGSEYTLSYPNRKNPGLKHYGNDLPALSKDLEKIFKDAEKGTLDLSGPQGDMQIGYVSKGGSPLASYTVYDTPGPNREGKGGSEEAESAYRAVEETDMMIFAINYANHISTEEVDYLRRVLEKYEEQGKRYSLVIAVNRMDERYTGEEGKCTVALLDLIRYKLKRVERLPINSFMVIGTSSLTYFNCLEAPHLIECEGLDLEADLSGALKKGLRRALDEEDVWEQKSSPAKTVLNQLTQMMNNVELFDGVPCEKQTLSFLKMASGMPNLLSYMAYVAEGNAKTEKLYALMRDVDKEYRDIANMFHLEQLRRTLAQRRDVRDQAIAILNEFVESVRGIYTWTHKLLSDYLENNTAEDQRSGWLNSYLTTINFKEANKSIEFNHLKDFVLKGIRDDLDLDQLITEITKDQIPYQIKMNLDAAFDKVQHHKVIKGENRALISEKECVGCIKRAAESTPDLLGDTVLHRYQDLNANGRTQGALLTKYFEALARDKQQEFNEAAKRCAERLKTEAEIPFQIETPVFNVEIDVIPGELPSFSGRELKEKLVSRIEHEFGEFTPYKGLKIDNNAGLVKRIWDSVKVHFRDEDINRVCYDSDYVIREVYHNNIKHYLYACLMQARIGDSYRPQLDAMLKSISDYFEKLKTAVEKELESGTEYKDRILGVVDHTKEAEQEIDLLERQYNDMQTMNRCFTIFSQLWLEVRPEAKI